VKRLSWVVFLVSDSSDPEKSNNNKDPRNKTIELSSKTTLFGSLSLRAPNPNLPIKLNQKRIEKRRTDC